MKKLDIYADGIRPDKAHIDSLIEQGICGFTANPSLCKQYIAMPSGMVGQNMMGWDYEQYSKFIINNAYPLPVSVQVLSSYHAEMEKEARTIASWGENVYVKIPIINEFGESNTDLIIKLLNESFKINVTAVFTEEQVYHLMADGLKKKHDCIISVFCGRIADTGLLPQKIVERIHNLVHFNGLGTVKLLWAGVRSISDIHYAKETGCDIITIPQGVLDKLPMKGKDLDEYCLETVVMFANDAKNFTI